MYCPRCGVRNLDDASFCRACGADISLVPQALDKSLPAGQFSVLEVEEQEEAGRKGRKVKFKEPPTLEKALENIFVGIAFMIIFALGFFYFWGGVTLWVWLIIPALAYFGDGIGQLIRSRREVPALPPAPALRHDTALPQASPSPASLPPRDTSEIRPRAPSVTEATTRNLGAQLDPPAGRAPAGDA